VRDEESGRRERRRKREVERFETTHLRVDLYKSTTLLLSLR
jgi:hypothetical protein